MVVVEVLAPVYDEEAGEIEWRGRAIVKVDGSDLKIYGDETVFGDGTMTVVEPESRRKISRDDEPEAWARNLPYAYRAGDLVAVVSFDSDSPGERVEPEPPRDLPVVPAPQTLVDRVSSAHCA